MIPDGMRPSCKLLHRFDGHRDAIYALEPSGDGRSFFSSGGDGMVVRWSIDEPDNGTVIARIEGSVYSLAYDPVSEILVAGKNNDGLHSFNPKTGKAVGSVHTGAFSIFDICIKNGIILTASGDGNLRVIDSGNWTIRNQITLSVRSLRCIARHPAGGPIAIGCSGHRISLLDSETLEKISDWEAHHNSVFTLSYGTDGGLLYSGSRDARLRTWRSGTQGGAGSETAAHLFAINHIAFRPDGKHFLTCSMDKTIKVWSSGPSPSLQRVLDRARHGGHSNSVNRLCWINEDTFASAGDDRIIHVWKFIPSGDQ